jgi:hypothetical protein
MSTPYPQTWTTPTRSRINVNPARIWRAVPFFIKKIRCDQIREENFRNCPLRYEGLWKSGEKHDPESGIHLAVYQALQDAGDQGISQADLFGQIQGATQDHLREMRNQGIIFTA